MDLSGIISIGGMSGLYKVVAQSKNGIIVESLVDKKRIPAYSNYKISGLEEISVFSTGDDIPLKEVFTKIADKEKLGAAIEHKAAEADLKKYFLEALPNYDQERVHISDIRKVIQWYNILQKSGWLKKEEEKKESDKEGVDVKAALEEKSKIVIPKVKSKETSRVKTSSSKVKPQTVRKNGA
ncbi:MAG: DUF5606 domain-containing protein [Bacteroidia bacterium]